ncbi:hypothetical protein FHU38_003781 [Saccharomonospora amisosensis]|uniref:Uncharacterized protein n=1 Tax=Saccharomonospora amisosensis TaxID=1128677 RepID=A0A7X5ZS11_9PSEU|nr:hypothetical protein [Saccharomonospora amisosensis]
MVHEDALDRLLRAWREDIDSEPFPVITDVVLPRQRRRQVGNDENHTGRGGRPRDNHTSSPR